MPLIYIDMDRTTYSDLLDYLQDVRDWRTLATYLLPGMSDKPIENISAIHNGNVRECKKALFNEYLEIGDGSWKTVINALIKLGHDNLADDIRHKLSM